jgi:ubiquinone/menaquinone biosynthesis C-methylase UbiE
MSHVMSTDGEQQPIKRQGTAEAFDDIAHEFHHARRKPWPSLGQLGDCRGMSILDLGAGSGRNTRSLAECGADTIVAADISLEMLRTLLSSTQGGMLERINAVRCDAKCLPFKEDTFQRVAFVAALHHIRGASGRAKAMEETTRVTAPGGMVLVTVWDPRQALKVRIDKGIKPVHGGEPGDYYVPWGKKMERFYHFFSQGELEELMKSAGLTLSQVFHERASSGLDAENWVVVARKEG